MPLPSPWQRSEVRQRNRTRQGTFVGWAQRGWPLGPITVASNYGTDLFANRIRIRRSGLECITSIASVISGARRSDRLLIPLW